MSTYQYVSTGTGTYRTYVSGRSRDPTCQKRFLVALASTTVQAYVRTVLGAVRRMYVRELQWNASLENTHQQFGATEIPKLYMLIQSCGCIKR